MGIHLRIITEQSFAVYTIHREQYLKELKTLTNFRRQQISKAGKQWREDCFNQKTTSFQRNG